MSTSGRPTKPPMKSKTQWNGRAWSSQGPMNGTQSQQSENTSQQRGYQSNYGNSSNYNKYNNGNGGYNNSNNDNNNDNNRRNWSNNTNRNANSNLDSNSGGNNNNWQNYNSGRNNGGYNNGFNKYNNKNNNTSNNNNNNNNNGGNSGYGKNSNYYGNNNNNNSGRNYYSNNNNGNSFAQNQHEYQQYRSYNDSQNRTNKPHWNKPSAPYKHNRRQQENCCDFGSKEEQWLSKSGLSNRSKNSYNNNNNNNNNNEINPIYQNNYHGPVFDTHCHLDWILFKSGYGLTDSESFIKRNFLGNFDGCVTVACSLDMFATTNRLIAQSYKNNGKIYSAYGLHPHNAKEWNDNLEMKLIECLTQSPPRNNNSNDNNNYDESKSKDVCQTQMQTQTQLQGGKYKVNHARVVALGECGLDYHYNRSPVKDQRNVFIKQIELSKKFDPILPLVVHTRSAEKDTMEIMKKYCDKNQHIHLHCFTDSVEMALDMIKYFPNLFVGCTGCVTFRNAYHNRKLIENIPLNRLLLETDGPYMSPVPFRGKTSHPGYIPLVAETVAKVKNGNFDNGNNGGYYYQAKQSSKKKEITVDQVLTQCRQNAKKMYGI